VIAEDLPFSAVCADNDKVAPENMLRLDDADNPTFVPAVVVVVPLKCKVGARAFNAVAPDNVKVAPE
jgi:hypothetical protein